MQAYSKNERGSRLSKISAAVVMAGLLSVAGFAAAASDPNADTWKAPEAAKHKANPVAANPATLAEGKKLFKKECFSCHGAKGEGDGPDSPTLEKAPEDLSAPKVQDLTDGEIFWKITQGKKPMPSARKNLTEEQRWTVINYLRTLAKVKK